MTETEFYHHAEHLLGTIERVLDRATETGALDVECSRNGNVLEVEFIDSGAKIIINSQAPTQQMWIAAKSGGFHYEHDGKAWRDTRDGSELWAQLSALVSQQLGKRIDLRG